MCKIKKINTLNLKIFTYEIFKKMLSVNYEIITTFYRMTRTPQMLHCLSRSVNRHTIEFLVTKYLTIVD